MPESKESKATHNHKTRIQNKFLFFCLLFFLLSLFSKPAATTLPLVLLLLDYYHHRKFNSRVWLEKIPFFILSVLFGVIAYYAQQADKLLHDFYPIHHRLLFASHSVIEYLMKLFVPSGLSIFYPYPELVEGWYPASYYFSPFLVLLVLAAVFYSTRKDRLLAFGFLFFLVNILLVLQIITVGNAIMADRYSYLSYVGLLFVVAMVLEELLNAGLKKFRPLVVLFIIALVLVSATVTLGRTKVWKNDETIANDLIQKYPNDWLALNNKGFILSEQKKYDESIPLFKKAIAIRPQYTMASINLINVLYLKGDLAVAMAVVDSALHYEPHDSNLLNKKAYLYYSLKNFGEAIRYFEMAISEKPDNIYPYINMAECYYTMQDMKGVLNTVDRGLKYIPNDHILLNNKGYMLMLDKKFEEAVPYLEASLKNNPGYETASANLDNCYREIQNKRTPIR